MTSPTDEELIAAARAVVERWDTPHWKDVPATAVFINRLRDALCDRLEGRGGGERAGLLDAYEAFIKLDFMAAARPDLTAFCFKAGEACRIALGLPKPPPAGQAKQIAEARAALSREGEGWREAEGWKLVPTKALPAMLERAAFNLCAEYGVEFVKPLGKFVEDAYEELVSAAPAPPSQGGE